MGVKKELASKIQGLLMDKASRIARAKDQGFNVGTSFFHDPGYRYSAKGVIDKIRVGDDTAFDGVFTFGPKDFDPDLVEGPNEFFVKKRATHRDFNEAFYENPEAVWAELNNQNNMLSDLNDEQKETIEDYITERRTVEDDVDFETYIPAMPKWLSDVFGDDIGGVSWEIQRLRGRIAKALGFDAVDMKDETGISTMMLDGPGVRNVNAAFDPAQKESSNLLAGVGGAAVGVSALSPDQAEAMTHQPKARPFENIERFNQLQSERRQAKAIKGLSKSLDANKDPLLYANEISNLPSQYRPDVGAIEGPMVTDGVRGAVVDGINRGGHLLKKLQLPIVGNPLEGMSDYMIKFGYNDSPQERLKRAAMAGLDVL